ncbi:MAG: type II toxin-antitoxin system PemK/MazF family toxin [Myxococcales bacterium]|nr:type II toxin-antitoxin system PemK/MazF family toxin [Myxococcales bacterium]
MTLIGSDVLSTLRCAAVRCARATNGGVPYRHGRTKKSSRRVDSKTPVISDDRWGPACDARRVSTDDKPPGSSRRLVRRGELYWIVPDPSDDVAPNFAHPHVVVQDDVFNRSRVRTVIVCALTSNLHRANEPGNVLLDEGEGSLARRSVVVVSQISSVLRERLGERIGALSDERVDSILAGLRFQQAMEPRRAE